MLEKTRESPLGCKEITPINPKGNQPWIFIGRTDAEAEAPILLATWWEELTHWKRPWWLKRDWSQEEKGTTEDKMVGWHHWLNGHEFEQAPGVVDRQGSLVCCSLWGLKESDAEQLNWTKGGKSALQQYNQNSCYVTWNSKLKNILWSCILMFLPYAELMCGFTYSLVLLKLKF